MWPDFKQVLLDAIRNHRKTYGDDKLLRLRSATTDQTISPDNLIAMIEADHPDVIDFFCVDVIGCAIRALGLRQEQDNCMSARLNHGELYVSCADAHPERIIEVCKKLNIPKTANYYDVERLWPLLQKELWDKVTLYVYHQVAEHGDMPSFYYKIPEGESRPRHIMDD